MVYHSWRLCNHNFGSIPAAFVKLLKLFTAFIVLGLVGVVIYNYFRPESLPQISVPTPRPFTVYTIENLANTDYPAGEFTIVKTLNETPEFTSSLFNFSFTPNPAKKEQKMSTGTINLPTGVKRAPLVVMIRGYVDQEVYTSGVGTSKAAQVFAKNGYITLAPDFLGYAGSDPNSDNIFESRFQTYTLILSLLNSLDQIPGWDGEHVFIWAHSNGGQIALTVLEITGKAYPTTLWAPVSKAFPYNVLYYTDEADDKGKLIRHELAKFEDTYDTDLYSIHNYFDRITAPIQLHQGTADDAVPLSWSQELDGKLASLDKDITFYAYPGANHNMVPVWDTVVQRDLDFFASN